MSSLEALSLAALVQMSLAELMYQGQLSYTSASFLSETCDSPKVVVEAPLMISPFQLQEQQYCTIDVNNYFIKG